VKWKKKKTLKECKGLGKNGREENLKRGTERKRERKKVNLREKIWERKRLKKMRMIRRNLER
jgi:hypothetical protein